MFVIVCLWMIRVPGRQIDRQQQEIGALQERLRKAFDEVAVADKLRLEEVCVTNEPFQNT